MLQSDRLMTRLIPVVQGLGLTDVAPSILNESGNLIVHLQPHPVVARLAIVISEEDKDLAYTIAERELHVARHLQSQGIPAMSPTGLIDPGPHTVDGIWMTLWKHVPPTKLAPPSPKDAVVLVASLSRAMRDYPGDLPALRVWERTLRSAANLHEHPDQRVQTLLRIFDDVDQKVRSRATRLVACHGDAHARNLIPSPEGWLWMDFEDACLMPECWDMASYIGNIALFGGLKNPGLQHFLAHADLDLDAFRLALTARTLMSTLGNLDYALRGYGDLDFALRQLDLAEGFLNQLDEGMNHPIQ